MLSIYSIVPTQRLRLRDALPGTVAATMGWLAASIGFSVYVENFSKYTLLYGSIGAMIVLMLWLYLTGAVLIMGSELNAVIYAYRTRPQEFSPPYLTD